MGIHKWEPDIYIGFSPALHLQCSSAALSLFLPLTRYTVLRSILILHKFTKIAAEAYSAQLLESGNNRLFLLQLQKWNGLHFGASGIKNKWVSAAEGREGTRPYQLSN